MGLETEVVVWQPVGWGSSSFGHVSTNINGTTYSYGPSGMSVMATSAYMGRNSFRSGVGSVLGLSKQQEATLESCMKGDQGSYSATGNNCGDPLESCMQKLGISIGDSVFPASTGNALIDSGLVTEFNFYSATTPASGTSAPWAR